MQAKGTSQAKERGTTFSEGKGLKDTGTVVHEVEIAKRK